MSARGRVSGRPRAPTLRTLQRTFGGALLQPLTAEDDLAAVTRAGGSMAKLAATLIKPNDRLTSFARLQIYARSYWFRLIDCVYDDCPGLRAVLGEERFSKLVRAYLAKHPSRSFTLRNLCSRLAEFIRAEPRWTRPHTSLAEAVARFEWAQTVAFDGATRPRLTPAQLAKAQPARLCVALQPYLTLLALEWPLDDYVLAVKRREAWRAAASHTHDATTRGAAEPSAPRPRRGRTWLAVHRLDNQVYYKRLEPAAYRILAALAAGQTLSRAIQAGGQGVTPARMRRWFTNWAELGWLCPR
jgi:hypothetical protein